MDDLFVPTYLPTRTFVFPLFQTVYPRRMESTSYGLGMGSETILVPRNARIIRFPFGSNMKSSNLFSIRRSVPLSDSHNPSTVTRVYETPNDAFYEQMESGVFNDLNMPSLNDVLSNSSPYFPSSSGEVDEDDDIMSTSMSWKAVKGGELGMQSPTEVLGLSDYMLMEGLTDRGITRAAFPCVFGSSSEALELSSDKPFDAEKSFAVYRHAGIQFWLNRILLPER